MTTTPPLPQRLREAAETIEQINAMSGMGAGLIQRAENPAVTAETSADRPDAEAQHATSRGRGVTAYPGVAQLRAHPHRDMRWQEQAACHNTDPEAFFPTAGRYVTVGARRVCGECPVRAACLEYALEHSEWYGIWGGLSVDERRELFRRRKSVRKRVGA